MSTEADFGLSEYIGGSTTAAEAAVLEERAAPTEGEEEVTEEVTEGVAEGDETSTEEAAPEGETAEAVESSGDEGKVSAGEEEGGTEVEGGDELESLKATNTELLERIEELAQLVGAGTATPESTPAPAAPGQPAPVVPTAALPPTGKVEGMPRAAGIEQAAALEAGITLTQEQLEVMSDDAGKFNAYMANLVNVTRQVVREEVLREVVPIVDKSVSTHSFYTQLANDFFATNPSLRKYRGVVNEVSTRIAAAHADWPIQRVFEETAKESYRLLPHLEKKRNKRQKPKPAFAGGTGGKRPGPKVKLNEQQKHMNDLVKGL